MDNRNFDFDSYSVLDKFTNRFWYGWHDGNWVLVFWMDIHGFSNCGLSTLNSLADKTNTKMKKTFSLLLIFVVLISLSFITAHGEEDFALAEEIIKQKISCNELSEDQLEILGDYYMEQMHPGEAHEAMDEMMGGEGSESLRQIHINMGLSFYCGERGAMSGGMMNMMMGGTGMMDSKNMMMGGTGMVSSENMMGSFGNYGIYGFFGWIFMILVIVALVLLIIWLIKQIQKPRKRK